MAIFTTPSLGAPPAGAPVGVYYGCGAYSVNQEGWDACWIYAPTNTAIAFTAGATYAARITVGPCGPQNWGYCAPGGCYTFSYDPAGTQPLPYAYATGSCTPSISPFGQIPLSLRFRSLTCGPGPLASMNPINHIARWNGATWQGLGTGIDGNVWKLSELDGALSAGGDFMTANGLSSPFLARWSSPQPRLTFSQPQSGLVHVCDCWLTAGHEYYNVVSTDLSPGGVGTGPYGGLTFNDASWLWQQVALPVGTVPFHFLTPGTELTFGPYPVPPGLTFEALSVDVTGGVIGCLAPAQRYTVY